MKKNIIVCLILAVVAAVSASTESNRKHRIFIISSYHKEYLWSQDTQKGLCSAMLEFGFLDNKKQAELFTNNNQIESSTAIIQKMWMDTKHKNTRSEIAATVNKLLLKITEFSPDLIMLGDDNATNYIGNQFIDTDIPIVFWGVNGMPLKYDLLDSLDKPGHNVTGVYQAGYLEECLIFLKKIVPHIETISILSDDSPTGRSKAKELQRLSSYDRLPLKLVGCVVTNSLEEWKEKALQFDKNSDAFFILNHNSLQDSNGLAMDQLEVGKWYLNNIKKPECAHEKQFAQEGMLAVCDDSGFSQGYDAFVLAKRILVDNENPAEMVVKAPRRGPFIINRERANMLGIKVTEEMGAEMYIEKSLALQSKNKQLN